MSGDGTLFGRMIPHVAALASTCRETTAIPQDGPSMRQVAVYKREKGWPFRVVHDATINRPYGRFAVYVGTRRVGAQLSFPSSDDCQRMETPAPLSEPYEKRLAPEVRLALGMVTNSRTNPQARAIAIKRARAQFRKTNQSVFRKHGQ